MADLGLVANGIYCYGTDLKNLVLPDGVDTVLYGSTFLGDLQAAAPVGLAPGTVI